MRVVFIPPSTNEFKKLLGGYNENILKVNGSGLSDIQIFNPAPRKRGGGIFSSIAKTIFPFLMRTVAPVAKEFGSSVIKDIFIDKKPVRNSIKRRGTDALKTVGRNIFKGAGRVTKKQKKRHIKDIYSLI